MRACRQTLSPGVAPTLSKMWMTGNGGPSSSSTTAVGAQVRWVLGEGMGLEGSANLAPKARDFPGDIRHQEGFKYYHVPKSSSIFMILLALFQGSSVKEVFSLM